MTTKTFSRSQAGRMGRNPFGGAKPVTTSRAASQEAKPAAAEASPAAADRGRGGQRPQADSESLLLTALWLPMRTFVFGVKSLLVARYLFAHREEWRF